MKRKIFFGFITTVILALLFIIGWLRATAPNVTSLPALQDADIVFQTDKSAQMEAIFFATGSLYTHVGIVKKNPSGAPSVIEAVGPVRAIPLADWIRQGNRERLTIKRMQGLDAERASRIVAAAESYYGKPYDMFFNFNRDSIYCSELVYYAFQDGAKINLGHVQKISELNLDNLPVRKILESRWREDPICKSSDVDSFEACFRKLKQQEIITPASLAKDGRLDTLYDNYGFLPR